MFTGLIRDVGKVVEWNRSTSSARMSIETQLPESDLLLGASVACNGVCLTVVHLQAGDNCRVFDVELGPETLAVTRYGLDSFLGQGSRINLEPAVRMGDPLGGHVVTGHVDALGTVLENTAQDDGFWRLRIHFEDNFGAYVFKKGSVSVSGVSLTVANCNHQECWLEIMLIPHTLQQTNLTDFSIGSRIELEFDSQAKMVAEMLENMLPHLLKTRSSKN